MKKALNKVKDKLFQKIHLNNLVYNTCWEDPRCDRQLLKLDEKSKVLMITSAGCNALDYLLDNPAEVHTVDVNVRQNALLALKQASFRYGDYERHFQLFGEGYMSDARQFYFTHLREQLLPEYAAFWDEKISYFCHKNPNKTFYFRGTAGQFAWLLYKYLNRKDQYRDLVNRLMDAKDIPTQLNIYDELEPKMMSKFVRWAMNRHLATSLLGVPRPQRQLMIEAYPEGGVSSYIAENLRYIFTALPMSENYFWKLYAHGKYSHDCCPNYLKEAHFKTYQGLIDKLHINTTTISNYLKSQEHKFSHYVLLDHQDWLASYDNAALEEEWRLILEKSNIGTKILQRSAALKIDFFPQFVLDNVEFEQELTQSTHKQDRVGTYGSVYMAMVK